MRRPETIEKTFTDCVMEVVALDGIEIVPGKSAFGVRIHDLHRQLPEIVVKPGGDTFQDKDRPGKKGSGKGPFAAAIWGHWYWGNSPQRNRTEVLDEAVVLAKSGLLSLL